MKRRRKRFAPERAGDEGRSEDVKAGGAVLVKAEQEEIRRTFTSNRVTGDLANSIKCTAVKKRGSGQCVEVYPHGKTVAGSGTQPLALSTNTGEPTCPRARGSRVRTRRQRRKFKRLCGRHGRTNRNDKDTVDRLLKSTLDALCPNVAAPLLPREGWYIYHISACFFGRYGRHETTKRTARNTHTGLIFTRNAIISPFCAINEAGVEGGGLYGLVIDPKCTRGTRGFTMSRLKRKYYEQTEV